MHSLTFRLQYRPIRIGWCIRAGDFPALRKSLRRTFTLCGGTQNPLIVIDDFEGAAALVDSAHVDLLLAVRDDAEVKRFIDRFDYLPSWSDYQPLFVANARSSFLDILSVARALPAEDRHLDTGLFANTMLFDWADNDPLGDVLLASCGGLPLDGEDGGFVAHELKRVLSTIPVKVNPGAPPPADIPLATSLRTLCTYGLEYDLSNARENAPAGFFLGGAGDFWSVVNYWNLRASGWHLLFYDPTEWERLKDMRDAWSQRLLSSGMSARPGDGFAIVAPQDAEELQADWLPKGIVCYPNYWGAAHAPISIPPLYYPKHNALANVGTSDNALSATMAMPPPPFRLHRHELRNVALVVHPVSDLYQDDQMTFQTPNIPLLNTYYGERAYFDWHAARVDPHGLALLQRHFLGTLTLRALNVGTLIRELFRRVGIDARPSSAGLIAARVISQMGKLDNCRAFRVRGLRTLIESTRPESSFTRSHAIQTIREPVEGRPGGVRALR